jgi:hypothetical protein
MRDSITILSLLLITACADSNPAPVTTAPIYAVAAGERPRPLIPPDIIWTDGIQTTNHASIPPTRGSYDGRITFEAETPAKRDGRCFRLIRPELLSGHITGSTQALGAAERVCLPASTFHASVRTGLLGIQGAVCDASPTQPQGRVDPRAGNGDPQACPGDPTSDCYHLTSVTHFEQDTGAPNEVWSRAFLVKVTNPKTTAAQIASVTPLAAPVKMEQTAGSILEPVVSGDGRLLVYHDGRTVKYAVNPPTSGFAPCDARGFNQARTIADMFTDPLMASYGIAKFQLRDSENNLVPAGAEVGGAYPWIDRNAANLFVTTGGRPLYFQSPTTIQPLYPVLGAPVAGPSPNPPTTLDEIRAIGDIGKRSGITVMGLWTEGKMVVLDSRLNNSDLAILNASPPINDRMIDLYTATPGGTRIGASNNFFINSIENALDYDPDLRPSIPRDVVWQLSSTTGTDEVAFDDYLLRRALIVSPMNPSVNNTDAALPRRNYNDGFNATDQFTGTGFTLVPHVQNAATSVYWKIPAFGSLIGGARVEPIAAGGARGKGIWLDGIDDHIDYVVPTQTQSADMTSSAWMVALWVNPTTALDGTARQLMVMADGTQLNLFAARVQVRRGTTIVNFTVPIPLRLATTKWSHLALVSTSTTLSLYVDGFLVETQTAPTPMLRPSAGTFTVGANTTAPGVTAWIDDLKVIARAPNPEELCNHAYGTLVGVTSGPGFDLANNYPDASHAAVSALLPASAPHFSRYYCESQVLAGADAPAYACRTSRTDPRCIGGRVIFPEGPLKHSVPRPSSSSNAFCLSCHDNTNPFFTLRTAALAFTPGVNLEDDRRRQPMQPPPLLFGTIPANLFGPALPVSGFTSPATGTEVDPFILPAGP